MRHDNDGDVEDIEEVTVKARIIDMKNTAGRRHDHQYRDTDIHRGTDIHRDTVSVGTLVYICVRTLIGTKLT